MFLPPNKRSYVFGSLASQAARLAMWLLPELKVTLNITPNPPPPPPCAGTFASGHCPQRIPACHPEATSACGDGTGILPRCVQPCRPKRSVIVCVHCMRSFDFDRDHWLSPAV